MDNDKLWNEFMQSGTVESYLSYAQHKSDMGKAEDNGNRGIDNQVNQIR